MKATGIIRRIDDLGRIVIPRDIRKEMRIREGEPLEIFVDRNENLVGFKKYDIEKNYLANYHEALFENWVSEELITCDIYE